MTGLQAMLWLLVLLQAFGLAIDFRELLVRQVLLLGLPERVVGFVLGGVVRLGGLLLVVVPRVVAFRVLQLLFLGDFGRRKIDGECFGPIRLQRESAAGPVAILDPPRVEFDNVHWAALEREPPFSVLIGDLRHHTPLVSLKIGSPLTVEEYQ